VPMFSPQCVISGLPKLARPGELKMQQDDRGRYYESSTYMALNFILQKGISTDLSYPLVGNFPFVGYCAEDKEFERPPTIYKEPRNRKIENLLTHCAVVVGVGRRNGDTFLHIQNSSGSEWGKNGFGYISLHMFYQLQGLKNASEHVG
ncbi:cathepsin L-like cysteine proteinase, partial [Trifolium medium]|nr:cathepsin L-like cysteine proteinase [Trifolium medium]